MFTYPSRIFYYAAFKMQKLVTIGVRARKENKSNVLCVKMHLGNCIMTIRGSNKAFASIMLKDDKLTYECKMPVPTFTLMRRETVTEPEL